MAGFDTSDVAAHVGQGVQSSNPLQTIEQLAGTQNALNQNRMFQAKALAGGILQQSIGPDGQPDMGKFSAGLQADPRTAPFAPEILQAAATLRGTGITNQTSQQALATKQFSTLQSALAQTGSDAEVAGVIHRLVESGQVLPKFAAEAAGGNIEGLDMASIGALRKQAILAAGNAAELNANVGTIGQINTGGTSQSVVTKVGPNGATVEKAEGDASALPMTLTPEAKVARVGTINPETGAPQTVPLASIATDTGEPKPLAGVTGEGGALAVGLAPGVQGAFETTGQGNAQQALALQGLAGGVNNRKALLGNLSGTLDNFSPGPQSDFWKGLGQLAAEYKMPIPGAPPADKTAAQEEFAKLAVQLAQAQFAAIGGTGTDAKLSSAVHTSPSEFLSSQGNKNIIALLKGNEDAIAAQNDAWQKWQKADPIRHGPQSFGNFQAQFNKLYDPRVFQSEYMEPDQRKTMLKGMTAAEKNRFEQDYKNAVKLGWINGQ